jgi:hypothetical protein
MSARRQEADWVDGTDCLHVAEQYAGRPGDGIVFSVRQRTTGAGRAVLLRPIEVMELYAWLGNRLNDMGERLRGEAS